jgi:negative regulator of flagellin synthesis FlgM
VPSKISGVTTSDPVVAPKGAGSGAIVHDKVQGGTAPSSTPSSGDHVTLTDSARSLQKLSDAIAAAPAVDHAKVAAVKSSIAAGTYRIDAQRVADKLLNLDSHLK